MITLNDKKYLTKKETAEKLQVSTVTVDSYRKRKNNPLPTVGNMGRVYVREDVLIKWLEGELQV